MTVPAAVSAARRREVIDALRRGTVPHAGWTCSQSAWSCSRPAIDDELPASPRAGRRSRLFAASMAAARPSSPAGWPSGPRGRLRGFRGAGFRDGDAAAPSGDGLPPAHGAAVNGRDTPGGPAEHRRWLVLHPGRRRPCRGPSSPSDGKQIAGAHQRTPGAALGEGTGPSPLFAAALRGYREAQAVGDRAMADGIDRLAGRPAQCGRCCEAGSRGQGGHRPLRRLELPPGLLAVLRDSGHPGLLIVLDEVETIQRVRGDVRDKGLNALRQLIDEVDSGRFPGLYLLITGTPAFFDGPQGVSATGAFGPAAPYGLQHRRPLRL